jgi:hypothetical protein
VSEEAEMCFIGKLSRGKRGVGSIIGATFLVLILLTGYTFYFLNVDVSADYSKTLEDMQELDQKRNKENIEFTTVSFNQDGKLNITVKNTGSQQTHFIWLGIVDETANTQKYYAIDSYVDPAETVPDIRNETITIFEGQDRVIQLVTELGNTFTYNYPLSEEESTDTYDFVDNDTSNKDDSDDIGAHSLFSAEQAGPDGIVDGLTEGDTGGAVENDVDSNGSDEDGSADIGTETNFSYATGTSLDSNYMNTQEANTGTSGSSEWLDCNTFDSDRTGWEEVGSSPYLGAQDYPSNYTWSTTNNRMERYFYFPSTTLTGTLSVTISIYCNNDDGAGDDKADVYVDYTGSGTGSYVGSVAQHTNWQYDTIDLGSHTVSEVNNLRVYFRYNGEGSADDVRIDHVRIGVNSPASPNYEIDFEYKWTSAAYSSDNEEVCIYVAAHTGSETLSVNYWSGSWTSLGTITSTGWNNFTATGLTSPTYTIRLVGTTESSDSDQDDWDIDLVTLHTWNASNYELDLEVQWTGVDYDETNEWLSIYGGTMGAEDILVDVWNGTAWINLFTDLSSGWNSVDVSSYLVSSTFTIRFRDAVGDATDDRWEIDTAFLYVWS